MLERRLCSTFLLFLSNYTFFDGIKVGVLCPMANFIKLGRFFPLLLRSQADVCDLFVFYSGY